MALFVQKAVEHAREPLKVLEMCGGLYICPKKNGRRIGPLVPYRATDEQGQHLVGDLYANWAKVEQWPTIADALAGWLLCEISEKIGAGVTVYCGAPEGGKHLADKLARRRMARYVYPEKKGEDLVWGRHEILPGDKVVIVEDVANNFSTTEKLIKLIWQGEGTPVSIATYLNRSPHVRDVYQSPSGLTLPICALVSEPWPEYRQDDPEVAADIAARNIVWDVKKDWAQLKAAMNAE